MDAIESALLPLAVSQLWQLTFLVLIVALAARLIAARRPHLAYLLWLLVLLKCITPPIFASSAGVFCWAQGWLPLQEAMASDAARGGPLPIIVQAVPAQSPAAADDAAREPSESVPAAIDSPSQRRARWLAPSPILFTIWLAGILIWLAVVAGRWRKCLQSITHSSLSVDPALQQQFAQLVSRIGVRRRARLIVTTSRFGPAVLGIWRPAIVLPTILVEGRSPRELEPILAHELLHIRRGDLLAGCLQIIAAGLWWFHPLVWWACRRLSHEMERCCDEQTIAELRCDPAEYARALLAVLERKHELQAVPALPGVRSIEVTQQRLERIMQLGQGCRKRTPWWNWMALLVLGAIVLPGGALVAAKDRQKQKQNGGAAQLTRAYDVADLVERVQEELSESHEDAQSMIAAHARSASHPEARVAWSGDALVVRGTRATHRGVARELGALREHGFIELKYELQIVSTPASLVEELKAEWRVIDAPAELAADEDFAAGAETTIHKSVAARTAIVDKRAAQWLAEIAGDRRTTILHTPQVIAASGRDAVVQLSERRPFVVAVKQQGDAQEPVIRVVDEGWRVHVRGRLGKLDRVQLDLGLVYTRVHRVETAELQHGVTVQVPEVATTRVHAPLELALGQTAVLTGLPALTAGNEPPLTVLVRVTKARLGEPPAPPLRAAQPSPRNGAMSERVYHVADLVLIEQTRAPVLGPIFAESNTKAETKTPVKADFQSLIDLIELTILPSTWERGGGEGTVRFTEKSLSLAIRQSEDVHAHIAALLDQLRRLQDVQVVATIEEIELAGDAKLPLAEHSPAQLRTADEVQHLRAIEGVTLHRRAKVTLFNGQPLLFKVDESEDTAGPGLRLQPVVTSDARRVQWSIARQGTDAECTIVTMRGESLLIDTAAPAPVREVPTLSKIPHLGELFSNPAPLLDAAPRKLYLITPRVQLLR